MTKKTILIIGITVSVVILCAAANMGGMVADTFKYTSTSDITNTTAVEIGAANTSRKYCVTGWAVSNTDASVTTVVNLLDGTTPIWHCPAAIAGGGCTQSFDPPVCGTVNTALNVEAVTTSAQVRVSIKGRLALAGE